MRFATRLLGIVAFLLGFTAMAAAQQILEKGKDRLGGDYASIPGTANALQCANLCSGQPACQAFTWVKPGFQGPFPVCHLKNVVPPQSANNCCTSGVKLVGGIPAGAQAGKDRAGSDYNSFNLPAANPQLCANACTSDGNCQAWSFVKPGIQGPTARCYLKNAVPLATNNSCCVSGVKPVVPLPPGAQANRDRPGGDYSVTNLATPNPTLCYNACQANGNCQSWSYVKPGFQGPTARCYLKNIVPALTNNPCCVTGFKALPPLPPGAVANKDRPGNDIAATQLPAADPNLCYQKCQANSSCAAWVYVKPGVQGPTAECYLKNIVAAPVNDTCCITGVKPLPPLPPGAQANKDRPGSDYSSFALGVADPSLCYNSCQADANCQSWSFVKPGFQGPSARCYLKNAIPFAVNNPCCVTGAKAAPPPPALPPGSAAAGRRRRRTLSGVPWTVRTVPERTYS